MSYSKTRRVPAAITGLAQNLLQRHFLGRTIAIVEVVIHQRHPDAVLTGERIGSQQQRLGDGHC